MTSTATSGQSAMSFIPAPRQPLDDTATDAELHEFVADNFARQAEAARAQCQYLLMIQTAAGNRAAAFQAGVADILDYHAQIARTDAQDAKHTEAAQ